MTKKPPSNLTLPTKSDLAMGIYKYDHPAPLARWSLNEEALVRTEKWLYPLQVQLEKPRAFRTPLPKKYILQCSICRTNHLEQLRKIINCAFLKLAFLSPLHILVQNILG